MGKYRIYIDEVGNSDIESSTNPNHRFLSLTGVILELDYVKTTLHPQLEKIKSDYFDCHPDDPLIFHRKELVNAKPPFEALKNDTIKETFDITLLAKLTEWNYTVITVCLDKKRHKENYTTWRYDPYHYCLEVLLERYAIFLNQQNKYGDVMAESRGGKPDRRLKNSFSNLWKNGSNYVTNTIFQKVFTSRQLKVKPKSNNIAGLQIADLLAHPSRNEILKENNRLEKELGLFAQNIIKILQTKYYQRDGNVYGKKYI